MDCPLTAATSGVVINPPLTFVIDTTRSVKPDKDSIFNLTQRVVDRIQETNTNIPQVRQHQCIGGLKNTKKKIIIGKRIKINVSFCKGKKIVHTFYLLHIFSIFQYQLVTFNDYGPDITQNVEVREPTEDLNRFKQEILGLEFESFDGGRDSKERLLQGLLVSIK